MPIFKIEKEKINMCTKVLILFLSTQLCSVFSMGSEVDRRGSEAPIVQKAEPGLDDISDEVFIPILQKLQPTDIHSIAQVNRYYRNLCQDRHVWRSCMPISEDKIDVFYNKWVEHPLPDTVSFKIKLDKIKPFISDRETQDSAIQFLNALPKYMLLPLLFRLESDDVTQRIFRSISYKFSSQSQSIAQASTLFSILYHAKTLFNLKPGAGTSFFLNAFVQLGPQEIAEIAHFVREDDQDMRAKVLEQLIELPAEKIRSVIHNFPHHFLNFPDTLFKLRTYLILENIPVDNHGEFVDKVLPFFAEGLQHKWGARFYFHAVRQELGKIPMEQLFKHLITPHPVIQGTSLGLSDLIKSLEKISPLERVGLLDIAAAIVTSRENGKERALILEKIISLPPDERTDICKHASLLISKGDEISASLKTIAELTAIPSNQRERYVLQIKVQRKMRRIDRPTAQILEQKIIPLSQIYLIKYAVGLLDGNPGQALLILNVFELTPPSLRLLMQAEIKKFIQGANTVRLQTYSTASTDIFLSAILTYSNNLKLKMLKNWPSLLESNKSSQVTLRLARFILNNFNSLGLNEEHPLVQQAAQQKDILQIYDISEVNNK